MDFAKREEEILEFWKKNKIFEKSVKQRQKNKKFVFYEGPPYANGRPGIHHVEARSFKDVVLRYKTMKGYYVPRRAGWDTHGLPTEMEVEKKLGIKDKKEIEEKIGIEKFIEEAKKNVFLYKKEWEELTERMGYWLDMENAYVTMDNSYIESLWWIIQQIAKKGLLYEKHKVLPWCPRCGTALSSHEVSTGYKKVTEDSVYVRFRIKSGDPQWQNTSILSWTTTPWTLPGNVALAVNPEIEYVKAPDPARNGDHLVLGYKNFQKLEEKGFFGDTGGTAQNNLKRFIGKKLLGLEYEPLFEIESLKSEKSYKVYPAGFVTTEDGTAVVHTAVMYGEDDYELGEKIGLPKAHTVDTSGKFTSEVKSFSGRFVKEAEKDIIEHLQKKELIFRVEPYEHDYPFCWRCGSPLLYYARDSWWFNVAKVRTKMVKENQKIKWHPAHLKNGRFGEWLKEARDWAISRERYWGTAIPVWRCEKCSSKRVIGSLRELEKHRFLKPNKYTIVRHGEAESNKLNTISADVKSGDAYHLTKKGKKTIEQLAKKLARQKIDLVYSSDFLRTKETAEILSKETGARIIFDEKLRELRHGSNIEGKPADFYMEQFEEPIDRFTQEVPGGETLNSVKKRMMNFLLELGKKEQGKNIVIVSHGDPLWILECASKNASNEQMLELRKKSYIKTGESRTISLLNYPYNSEGNVDLHRPYLDNIFLKCGKCGGEAKRVREVMDVWYDSGAMPFAKDRYPFSNKKVDYPADYICEAIDQTRGWFYTLLAVAALLGKQAPYKNVLSLGLVLDERGQKMSKSKGNAVNPRELIAKHGVDAVRWYFYTINQPWDDKLFKEKDIEDCVKKFLLIYLNCFEYLKTYRVASNLKPEDPKLIINKWILTKLEKVAGKTTKFLDAYDIVSAARLLENFVTEDISRWYIRLIRLVMKDGKSPGARECSAVLGFVLKTTACLTAPFAPFISEFIFCGVEGKKSSVHLENWPAFAKAAAGKPADVARDKPAKLLKGMEAARDLVSRVLELRAKAGIKVRQPLQKFKISAFGGKNFRKIPCELLELIKTETNVRQIVLDGSIGEDIELDTKLTDELKKEGMFRDLVRSVQDLRKKAGLTPKEKISLTIETDKDGEKLIADFGKNLLRAVNLSSAKFGSVPENEAAVLKTDSLTFKLKLLATSC